MSARKSGVPSPVKGSAADLEQQLAAAYQQLDSTKKLYQRLHAHNDEMEAEFCRLQSVLEQVKHTATTKLVEEARCVRSELNLMREAVQFYTNTWQREFKSQQRMILTALGATDAAAGSSSQQRARTRSATPTGDPVHRALLQAFGDKVHSAKVVEVPAKKKVKKKRDACVDTAAAGGPQKTEEDEPDAGAENPPLEEVHGGAEVGTRKLTKVVQRLEEENGQLMQRLLEQEEAFAKQLQRLKLSHKESEITLSTQIKLLSGVLASRNGAGDENVAKAVDIPSPIAHAAEQDVIRAATKKLLVAHKRHVDTAKSSQPAMPELATALRAAERLQHSTDGHKEKEAHAHTGPTHRNPAPPAARTSPIRSLADQGLWAERELAHRSASSTPQRHAFVVTADRRR